MNWATACIWTIAVTIVFAVAASGCGTAAPRLRWVPDPTGGAAATVEVCGLTDAEQELLRGFLDDPERMAGVMAVRVDSTQPDVLPAVAGTYQLHDDALRFAPRFPLTPGVRYRATFHTTSDGTLESEFGLPPPSSTPTAFVEHVFPSASQLPENQLKFYLHFSAPMSRGQAYRHVLILDDTDKPVEFPFLELDEELWDPSGKRLTLFIDPGRIKRELRPLEEVGPVFEAGKRYTLFVDRRWEDVHGVPMKQSYIKGFTAGPADRDPLVPSAWTLDEPTAGGRAPLTVELGEPLDRALLERLLWITAADGSVVPGEVQVGAEESSWRFVPATPWRVGGHHLVVQTTLEDLAGNNVGRAFEVDVVREGEVRVHVDTVAVPFDVATPGRPR